MYRYIESEKGQTKMHRAREVHDWASPDCSHETDETLGMNLTQEQKRSNGVGSGMSVGVGNQLDVRKRKGQMSVGSGMSVDVGNRLDTRERKG